MKHNPVNAKPRSYKLHHGNELVACFTNHPNAASKWILSNVKKKFDAISVVLSTNKVIGTLINANPGAK